MPASRLKSSLQLCNNVRYTLENKPVPAITVVIEEGEYDVYDVVTDLCPGHPRRDFPANVQIFSFIFHFRSGKFRGFMHDLKSSRNLFLEK